MKISLSPAGRRYGLLPDSPDKRDLVLTSVTVKAAAPEQFSLIEWLGPVKDQGQLGACTGFAYAGMREFLYRKYYQYEKYTVFQPQDFIASPLFIYYQERMMEDTIQQDNGAQMRSGCRVLNRFGVCPEREDKYVIASYRDAPNTWQMADALRYKAGAYHRLETDSSGSIVPVMKSCLKSGYAFTTGIEVMPSFESNAVSQSGIVPMPGPSEQCIGGHAILVFGFDDFQQWFLCRNSWGAWWGDHGNFYLPYSFMDKYSYDAWTQHLGPAWR